MNRETIIRLAREAGWDEHHCLYDTRIERFYNLIHDHLMWSDIHTCNPGCTKPACVAVRKAVEAEREECAKVCEERKINPAAWMIDKFYNQAVEHCAAAIRSRT